MNKTTDNKQRTKKLIISLAIAIVVALSFLLGYFVRYWATDATKKDFYEIFDLADKYFYGDITATEEDYANAMVSEIFGDYSKYYSPETYKAINENKDGFYKGAGISFYTSNTVAKVYAVYNNSPAKAAGIKANDVIKSGKAEGGELISFTIPTDVTHFLDALGMGDKYTLNVERAGQAELTPFNLTMSPFVRTYVEYYDSDNYMCFVTDENNLLKKDIIANNGSDIAITAPDVALIKLSGFEGSAATELALALSYMKDSGRTKLIFDLRNNGGGYMSVFQKVAAYVVSSTKTDYPIIAKYVEKGPVTNQYVSPKTVKQEHITKTVVLANRNTASASEALIGAMRFYRNIDDSTMVIVKNAESGTARTYGKGVMQTTFTLSSKGAIKFTTAKLYLPDGKTSIDGKGFVSYGLNAVSSDAQAVIRAHEILA